jgi:hypothetical protein
MPENHLSDTTFKNLEQPALTQGTLGPATVTILGAKGLRLSGLTSFHLDEGPDFAWLNIYRTLATGRELEITREREPAQVAIKDGGVEVRWAACDDVHGELSAHYRLDPSASAVDATFTAHLQSDYNKFELFIANYFTPYYKPYYAVSDDRIHPDGLTWYEKQWYGEHENESWVRDDESVSQFKDGRWQTGYPLNWRLGPHYAYPLMIQEHRYGHAILLMARREDCIGLSGFNNYHNAQYLHLFGRDVAAGEQVSTTVRMVLLTDWDDLQQEAMNRYKQWTINP